MTQTSKSDATKTKRYWFAPLFRFRLRTLLLIVALFGVVIGPELYYQVKQQSAAKLLRLQNSSLAYDFDLEQYSDWKDRFPPIRSKLASTFRGITGSDLANPVIRLFLQDDSAKSIQLTAHLRHLKWLQIASSTGSLHDRNICPLKPLESCTELEYLVIGNWLGLTPNGSVGFQGTGSTLLPYDITETDLRTIGNLRKLRVLAIGGQFIDDDSIQLLAKLNSLEYLYLNKTPVSAAGIEQLKLKLPDLTIERLTDTGKDYTSEINSRF